MFTVDVQTDEPMVLLLRTDPPFEVVVHYDTSEDDRYDELAEQDLELILAEKGMPS